MSIQYVAEIYIDLGEAIHVRSNITPQCGTDLPFEILEASGNCVIDGHEIDVFLSPESAGEYRLRHIYRIADETWVDNLKIRVD